MRYVYNKTGITWVKVQNGCRSFSISGGSSGGKVRTVCAETKNNVCVG